MQGHPRRWAIFAVLCLAVFVVSIDVTVLNVALPRLAIDLDAGPGELQWIIDAYSLALAGLLLTAGSLSDRFGRKRFLIVGLVIFGVMSGVAAFAAEPWHLVAARAGMGVGAAFFMPGTLSILVQVFSAEQRAEAIGAWGAVTSLGVIIGPLLGGFLLEHFWWGSVFLVNVLVVAIAVLGAVALVPESSDPTPRPVDLLGTGLSTAAFVALTYGVISAPKHGWQSAETLTALGIGVLMLLLFILRQRLARHPMLELSLINRPFTGASLTAAVMMFAVTGTLFVLTQELQLVLGYGTLLAGLAFLPVAGAVMVGSMVGPALIKTVSVRAIVAFGLLLMAAGLGVMARFTGDAGYPPIAISLVVFGIGMGLATPLANTVMMSSGPQERSGLLSSMNDTVQELGAAFGVAVSGSVFASAYLSAYALPGPPGARSSLGEALVVAQSGPPQSAHATVDAARSAFSHGLQVSVWTCAAVIVVGAVLALFLLPKAVPSEVTAAEPEARQETVV
jgi:DHA2 family multidrug resistance protein-like MFS transporter